MMKGATEVTLETVLVSVLNVAAVYFAAFVYKLNWMGVLTVMILASLLTAGVTHMILSKILAIKSRTETVVSEGLGVMGVALVSALAVLVILTQRFNFPEALGIALLSGHLSSLVRYMLS